MKHLILVVLATMAATPASAAPLSLFNGVDLTGWSVSTPGGNAAYAVVDGAIVGTSGTSGVNTFLISDGSYSDFMLELDFMVDAGLNSGVQIRSYINSSNNYVAGYQIEIDPSARAWTGGLYSENTGRNWLDDLDDNPAAQAAFDLNDWNHFRIIADGNHIQSWINGVAAADYTDTDAQALFSGFIGLQVHGGVGPGLQVRWKNIVLTPIIPGDADFDGDVDLDDYNALSGNMYTSTGGGAAAGDFNDDGMVDFEDFVIQALHFGDGEPDETLAGVIPEPGVSALVLAGVLAVCARRGRDRRGADRGGRAAA